MRVAVSRILLPLCLAVASACNCGHVNPPLLPDATLPDGTVGVAYSASLAVMGGTSPFTYTVDGAPQGLTLDNTGKLSGTPTASGDFMLKVHVDDSGQLSADKTYPLRVGDALQFKTMSLPDGTAGTAYSQTIETVGGKAPVTPAVSGTLPAGLMFDPITGTLSGTPTTAGTSMVSFTATDAASQMVMKTFSLTIADALVFNPNALPDGNVGVAYMPAPLQATGGKAPLTFSISAGSLPGGVTLAMTGAVAGTPTTPGAFNFTVSVTDANGASVSHAFTVNIFDAMPPKVVTMMLPNAVVGQAYNFDLVGTDGALPYAWTVSMGTLPAGLMLGTNGAITGTPTAGGPSTFTVLVTDANMQTGKQSLTLTVYPALSLDTTMLNEGYASNAYAQTLAASGGQAPYMWSVAGGALPAGVTLTTGGILAGTPTASGSFGVAIAVSDASGQMKQTAFTLNIYDLPQVSNVSLADGAVGAPYMQPLTATGGKMPYTFTLAAGTLPAGLTLAAGQIAGVPTNTAVAPITVQVADANGKTGQKNFTLSVFNGLVITSPNPPDTDVGVMYSQTLTSTGGKAPIVWSVTGGSLPPGLALSSGGTLSGSPTMPGTYSFTVTATDANSVMQSKMYSITISGAPQITTTSLPDAYVGTAYSLSLTSTGGKAPLTWALQSGTLPANMMFSNTGVLQGTATAASSSSLTLTLTDANNQVATKTFSFSAVNPLVVTQGPLPDAYVGGAYSQTLASTGGKAPITWAVTSGTLPAGITLSAAGGLSGNATTPGTSAFTVTATDANNQTASKPLSVSVFNPPVVSTMSLPDGTLNVAYSQSLAANGGKSPLSWSVTSGALPAGLTLNSSGTISGMPTGSGTASFTVQVSDANGLTASQPLTIAVFASLTITTASPLNDSYVGAMYSQALAAAGGKSPYSWTLTSGSLPAGLALSTGGVISGTPTAASTSTFTVQVTDSNSLMQSKMLSLTAQPRPTISTVSLSDGYVGAPYSDMVTGTGGKPPYAWAVTAGALPAGVTLDMSSGALSGAPTGAGMSTFTLTLTDANSLTSPKSFTVGVYSAPQITTTSPLTDAYVGTAFMQTLAATGGKAPLTWTVSSGALPAGLTLDMTGVVSGIPTAAGPAAFSVKVTDANGKTGTKSFSQTALNALTFTTTTVPAGYVGTAYPSTTLSVTGGKLPYGFAVTGGALPAGLTLSGGGTLSGTPTVAGPTSFTVTVTDGNNVTTTQTYTPTIYTPPSVTTASPLPDAYASTMYTQTLAGSGGKTPYTWSISAGALPAGLTLSPAGVISGQTTVTGAASFTVTLTDANSVTAAKPLAVTVLPALTVTTTTLADGYLTQAYPGGPLAAAGGKAPYSFSVSAGALPAGITLMANGTFTGTPTAAGTASFTAQVTDANGKTATAMLSIAVYSMPSITTTTLPDGYLGTAYSGSIAGGGGKTPYTFTLTLGSLPAGLTLQSGGSITGTPTSATPSTFTVQLTDANNVTTTKSLTISVNQALLVTTASLNDAYLTQGYSQTLSATGGKMPLTWSVTVGTLPAGLTLTPGTGLISGTPTAAGTASFTATVTDANNVTSSKPLSIAVFAMPSITTTTLPDGYPALTYNGTVAGTGGKAPYTFTVTVGSLPAGLALAANGTLSGAPTGAPGTSSFTVQLKDVNNVIATSPLSIIVRPTLQVTTTTLGDAYVGLAYNTTLAATGGKPGYTWSIGSGTLPAGLTLTPATGAISGTPTAAGTSSFTVVATDANGVQASQPLTIQTYAQPSVTTTSPLPVAYQGTLYNLTLTEAGGKAPYTWSVTSGSPPAGVTLSPAGVLMGTPTTVQTATFTAQVTDANGKTGSTSLQLQVVNGFNITTTSLNDGYTGSAYSQTLAATGGVPGYHGWTVVSGTLPAGLSLNAATGVLSGTPTVTGPQTITIQVSDSASPTNATTSKTFTVTVYAPPTVTTVSPLPDGYVGVAYNQTLAGANGKAPYTWAITIGTLPAGLSLTSSTGQISGSPTTGGPSTFTATLTDSNGVQASKSVTMTIYAKPFIDPSSPPGDAYLTQAYAASFVESGGKAPLTWSISAGAPPGGITIAPATGNLSGTPSAPGTFNFTVLVTDANLQTSSFSTSITVYALPSITTTVLPDGYLTVAYSQTLASAGGKAPFTWSVQSGALPAGITLTPSTGALGGIPTTPGLANFTMKVTDANGKLATQALSINIDTALTITKTSLIDAYRTVAYGDAMTATGGKPAYTWTISSGSPPSNITMNLAGMFSGTPTAASVTSTFVVKVTDQNGTNTTQSLTLNVYDPLNITTSSLPDGYISQTYSGAVAATGGKAPLTWSLSSGAPPTGITLNPDGTLSGTVAAGASSTMFTVKVTDANGINTTKTLGINIFQLPSITTASPLGDGYAATAYSVTFAASGGKPALTWSQTFGTLPTGLALSATGTLSGTIAASVTNGQVFNFTVTVTDQNAKVSNKAFQMTVYQLPTLAGYSPQFAVEGVTYLHGPGQPEQITAANGKTPYTFGASPLPSGLTVATSTGVVSGIPTQGTGASSPYMVAYSVTDANGKTANATLPLTVVSPTPQFGGGTQGISPQGSPITDQLTVFVVDSGNQVLPGVGVRVRKNGVEYSPAKQALTDANGKAWFSGLALNGTTDTVDITANGTLIANATMLTVNAALVTLDVFDYPVPGARANMAYAFDTSQGKLQIFGGNGPAATAYGAATTFNFAQGYGDVMRCDTPSTGAWTEVQPPGMTNAPSARYNAVAANVGPVSSLTYLYGGVSLAGAQLGDFWKYDSSVKTWTVLPPIPSQPQRTGAAMTWDGTTGVVVYGGSSGGSALNDTWRWTGATWQMMSSPLLGLGRYYAGSAITPGSHLMVVCGGLGSSVFSSCMSFSAMTNSWSTAAFGPLSSPRYAVAMAAPSTGADKLYAFGGLNGGTVYNDLQVWNGSWSTIVPTGGVAPSGRFSSALAVDSAGNLVLFGGQDASGNQLDETWTFNTTTNTWTQTGPAAPPQPPTYNLSGTIVNGSNVGFGAVNKVRVYVEGTSGYIGLAIPVLTNGTGSYTVYGIPQGDTVFVHAWAFSQLSGVNTQQNYLDLGVLGPFGSDTTQNISFPSPAPTLLNGTASFVTPGWPSGGFTQSGSVHPFRAGYSGGNFGRNGSISFSAPPGFNWYPESAPVASDAVYLAQSQTPRYCEWSYAQALNIGPPAVGPITLQPGPRNAAPGVNECEPNGTGLAIGVNLPVPGTPILLAAGDFNSDGIADVAVAQQALNQVQVLLADGTGNLQNGYIAPGQPGPMAIGSVDLNNDGKLDLVVGNSGASTFALTGDGTGFFATYAIIPQANIGGIAFGDMNGDGFQDYVLMRTQSPFTMYVYTGGTPTPPLAFSTVPCGGLGGFPRDVVATDLNVDGRPDIVVACQNGVSVYFNTGGTFAAPTNYPAPGGGTVLSIVAARMHSGAGPKDIVMLFQIGVTGYMGVYTTGGGGALSGPTQVPIPGGSPGKIAAGDFNSDGLMDIALSIQTPSEMAIFGGDGTGNLSQTYFSPLSTSGAFGIAAADYNGDGKTDVVIAETAGSVTGFVQLVPYPTVAEGAYTFTAPPAQIVQFYRGAYPFTVDWSVLAPLAGTAVSITLPQASTLAPARLAPSGQLVSWQAGVNSQTSSPFNYNSVNFNHARWDFGNVSGGYIYQRQ